MDSPRLLRPEPSEPPLEPADPVVKGAAKSQLQACATVVLDFLQSKCLFTAERALRSELELVMREMNTMSDAKLHQRSMWHSKLEKLLELGQPSTDVDGSPGATHFGPIATALKRSGKDTPPKSLTPTDWQAVQIRNENGAGSSRGATPPGGWASKGSKQNPGLGLYELRTPATDEEAAALQRQRGRNTAQNCVVSREGRSMSEEQSKAVEAIELQLLYNPHVRGLEDTPELVLT
eukprot:1734980-Prymnesium_polylepis.1